MAKAVPALVSTVPGLGKMLRNGGWQILSDRPVNPSSNTSSASSNMGGMTRWRHRAMFAADHLVLVFGNFTGDNSAAESPGQCTIKIRAVLQKNGATGLTDETGARIPVTFNGRQTGECSPDGLLYSDPIPFEVAKNEIFFVRSDMRGPGTGYPLPTGQNLGGSSNFDGVNNGEGQSVTDVSINGNSTQQAASNQYGACAVMGFSATAQKTVGLNGDSIAAGTGDTGYYGQCGGYLERVLVNLTALAIDNTFATSGIANFPYVKCVRGGYTLANFATRINSYKQTRVLELASTVITEYGTNDLAGGAAAMQANALIVAGWFNARGIKVIWNTLLPKTTSTDLWLTVANQTVTSGESARTTFNSWLRDTSASGFIAQSSTQGVTNGVWDAAGVIEINAAGVLTLNGGFWPAAFSTSDLTGTLTSASNSSSVTDGTKSPARNTYRGYNLRMTSGSFSGSNGPILSQTTGGQFNLGSSLTGTPSAGDSYVIYRPYTVDGTHPSPYGHMAIANGLNISANLSMIR